MFYVGKLATYFAIGEYSELYAKLLINHIMQLMNIKTHTYLYYFFTQEMVKEIIAL
jgi:hypothetical protein